MAIYLVDNEHFFSNLFDMVIEIVADFEISNEKQKFNQLFNHVPNHIDHVVKNKDLKIAVTEIEKLVNRIFRS